MLAAIILAPLLGAAILGLFGKRMGERLIGLIACSTVAVSAILSFYLFFKHHAELEQGEKIYQYLFTWISAGSFRADASLLLDSLSAVYILFITFVAFWIHVFATGYMRGDKGYWRFFAYMNLFMFSMLTLVLADNFLLMFVGWEGVGLCSYLLIVGATGKSAQLPLYVWLPDAMAGPTPVSALIHAATMVTAGVYMVSRASHLY